MFVLVVTGMSGAGKSHALNKLEDSGYFCVDNLPPDLIGELVNRLQKLANVDRVALGIDSRTLSIGTLEETLEQLKTHGIATKVLFLDASDQTLLRRYNETRRNHPLDRFGLVENGIAQERKNMHLWQGKADYYIKTDDMTPAQLGQELEDLQEIGKQPFVLSIQSFGFKRGLPLESETVFDARCIPNPFWIESLRDLTGQEQPVIDYVMGLQQAQIFLKHIKNMLDDLLPLYQKEGKNILHVAIGCTGGCHRSVCLADRLADYFREKDVRLQVKHRDLLHYLK